MTQPAQLPAEVASILTQIGEAIRPIAREDKSNAYVAYLGVYALLSKQPLVNAMNRLAMYGWGMADPPEISRTLVDRLGFKRIEGLNLKSGNNRGFTPRGRFGRSKPRADYGAIREARDARRPSSDYEGGGYSGGRFGRSKPRDEYPGFREAQDARGPGSEYVRGGYSGGRGRPPSHHLLGDGGNYRGGWVGDIRLAQKYGKSGDRFGKGSFPRDARDSAFRSGFRDGQDGDGPSGGYRSGSLVDGWKKFRDPHRAGRKAGFRRGAAPSSGPYP
jgi:ATP-dependent RNA helicase MSS116